jgi:hypothetical protein
MRTGPRIAVLAALLWAAMTAHAFAADSVSVIVSSDRAPLGETTTIAAHVETDAGFGGGHVDYKYRPADQDCAALPSADDGQDASGQASSPVDAGAQTTDVGGQMLEFEVGSWRICAWLVDDSSGNTLALGSAIVTIVPYAGSISLRVTKSKLLYQVVVSWDSSALAKLFVTIRRAGSRCPATVADARRDLQLVPKAGRAISGSGGLGRVIKPTMLKRGRYTVCAWIQDGARSGSAKVGPVAKTFSVAWPRGARASGR